MCKYLRPNKFDRHKLIYWDIVNKLYKGVASPGPKVFNTSSCVCVKDGGEESERKEIKNLFSNYFHEQN
jgi:hypothetical protein